MERILRKRSALYLSIWYVICGAIGMVCLSAIASFLGYSMSYKMMVPSLIAGSVGIFTEPFLMRNISKKWLVRLMQFCMGLCIGVGCSFFMMKF